MVRGRLIKGSTEYSRINQDTKMKTRLAAQKTLRKDNQQCITKFFEISPLKLVNSPAVQCGLTITGPSIPFYKEDCFESRYDKEMILVDFEKPPKIKKTEAVTYPSSPSHRIQLNTDGVVHSLDTKNNHKPPTAYSRDRQLTEFFPIRRSERKTKKIVQEEKQKSLEEQLRSGSEDGLAIHYFTGKGRGIVATKPFYRGDFVVEYSGELLDMVQAKQKEDKYAQDSNTGCYMYYFKFQNRQFCIDATSESGRLGRLINHSRNGNLITKTVAVDTLPRLVFIAKDFINVGEELCYDYGDRSKESLKHHPWLAL